MALQVPTALRATYEHLTTVSATVARHYLEVATVLQPRFTAAEFRIWTQHCVQLAQSGWRAWESTDAFLQLSPFLQQHLVAHDLWTWAEHGLALTRYSAEVATVFLQASKPLLQEASQSVFATWVAGSRAYLEQQPPLLTLAVEYFRLSPYIYGRYPLTTAVLWGQVGADLGRVGMPYGQTFFALSRTHLERTLEVDHAPAWAFAQHCLPQAPVVALDYLERYADLVHRLGSDSLVHIEAVLRTLIRGDGLGPLSPREGLRPAPTQSRQRAGGEGRCAPCDCVGRAAQFNGPLPCAHTVAPKGPQRLIQAPHPNPLPGGRALRPCADAVAPRAKTPSADTVAEEGKEGAADIRTFLRLAGSTLAFIPAAERLQALMWCQQIAAVSTSGVLDFLHHFADLQRRLPGQRLQPWVTSGIAVAQRNTEAGQAYFALESAAAQDRLQALQNLVAFAHIEPVLRLYTEALLGRRIALHTTVDLPAGRRDLPTSDGTAIFVPEQVSDFATARENFAAYKVAILHQVGFYECGTWQFDLRACAERVPGVRPYLNSLDRQSSPAEAFAYFFAAFPHPDLVRTLFTILEDTRIDASIARRYRGIRRDLALIMAHSLRQRPALQRLPLRQALLEGLLQCTLAAYLGVSDALPPLPLGEGRGEGPQRSWEKPLTLALSRGEREFDAMPALLRLLLPRLWQRLTPLYAPAATVYDTIAALVDCYALLAQIPAHAMTSAPLDTLRDLDALAAELPEDADSLALAEMFRQAGTGADTMPMLPDSTEPATGVEPVPYRGEVKPELIQKKMRLHELAEELQSLAQGLSPLPPKVLQELLKHGDIEIKSLQAGELTATSGLFVTNLEGREVAEPDTAAKQTALQRELEALQAELQQEYGELTAQSQAFLYDEWDYVIGDYRRAWCRLTETVLDDAGLTFVEDTRQRYAELFAQVSRQFQLLKPETFKPLKRLVDGEEIDLDSAIEAFVDRRASQTMPEKVYMRRNRRERSVAALFLLDMSASTDDVIKAPANASMPPPQALLPAHPYDFSGFVQDDHYATLPPREPGASPLRRRIIDVEKEALVLMAEALEGLGDAYAVYGFSGYGRDQVDCFVVKEFRERYDARVQGRIAAIKPHRSTRMGPAIRHAIRKFEPQDARVKLLLLLSDGYPQDYDYGKDRKSKEYGIQDTMMALHETRLKGIQTFCLTVDPKGHDYLRAMCPDQQYLVLEDMASLPKELPKVYRSLTT